MARRCWDMMDSICLLATQAAARHKAVGGSARRSRARSERATSELSVARYGIARLRAYASLLLVEGAYDAAPAELC
jgi:hypothetical protein